MRPKPLAQGRGVEQGLGRMLAGAVAGVDHRAVHDLGDGARGAPLVPWRMTRASGRMAFRVRAVSSSVSPFLIEAMLDLHRHHLRAEALGGDLEAQQGAGGILEEGVEDRQAVEAMVVAAG